MIKSVVLGIFILSNIFMYACGSTPEDKSIRIVHVVPGANNYGKWYSVYVYVPIPLNGVNGKQLLEIAKKEINKNDLDRNLRRIIIVNCDLKDAGSGTAELNPEIVEDCYLMDFSFNYNDSKEYIGVNRSYGKVTPEMLSDKELKLIVFKK